MTARERLSVFLATGLLMAGVAGGCGDDASVDRVVEELLRYLTVVQTAFPRFARRSMVVAESRSTGYLPPIDNQFVSNEFCKSIGAGRAGPEFRKPVSSAVPTLLLTGTLDATNPKANADDVARSLRGAINKDIVHAAHEALTHTAVQDVIVDFLKGIDVRGRSVVVTTPRYRSMEEILK